MRCAPSFDARQPVSQRTVQNALEPVEFRLDPCTLPTTQLSANQGGSPGSSRLTLDKRRNEAKTLAVVGEEHCANPPTEGF